MKRFIKKSFAVLLALMMLSCSFSCLAAAELNPEAVAAHKGQYKNYVLLGDSVASGYRDEMSENDAAYNELHMDSTYCRYTGSYGDVLSKAIVEGDNMTALAGPGFRTIEMRYMLEDDFAATCEDEYLFWPSHLYIYKNQTCTCHGVKMTPGSEHFRDLFKKSIAEADLITLGIGGNDWGAYLRWVIEAELAKDNYGKEYAAMAAEILKDGVVDMATIEKLVEIAGLAGALPALLMEVPEALNYGLSNFYTNWDIMIEDIYALNPDVTLMVVGMSDNSIKGKNYDYPGVVGEPIVTEEKSAEEQALMDTIIGFIMKVGNAPMIDGAAKFGYTYVDTDGTSYVDSHPDADGHVFIANKIIEALPDSAIFNKFEDVTPGHKYYSAVEYVVKNNIMTGTSDNTFSPDEALTSGQLNAAFNAINGTDHATTSTTKVTALKFALSFLTQGAKGGITGLFKGFSFTFRILSSTGFNIAGTITRAEAANYFKNFCA